MPDYSKPAIENSPELAEMLELKFGQEGYLRLIEMLRKRHPRDDKNGYNKRKEVKR